MFRYLYIFFLGVLLAITTIASISYVYPYPKAPEYPQELSSAEMPQYYGEEGKQIPRDEQAIVKVQRQYDEEIARYNEITAQYSFDANLLKIGVAVAFVVLAALLYGKFSFFPESLVLGGVLILLSMSSSLVAFYSFEGAQGANTSKLTNVHLAAMYFSLIIASALGYLASKKKKFSSFS